MGVQSWFCPLHSISPETRLSSLPPVRIQLSQVYVKIFVIPLLFRVESSWDASVTKSQTTRPTKETNQPTNQPTNHRGCHLAPWPRDLGRFCKVFLKQRLGPGDRPHHLDIQPLKLWSWVKTGGRELVSEPSATSRVTAATDLFRTWGKTATGTASLPDRLSIPVFAARRASTARATSTPRASMLFKEDQAMMQTL